MNATVFTGKIPLCQDIVHFWGSELLEGEGPMAIDSFNVVCSVAKEMSAGEDGCCARGPHKLQIYWQISMSLGSGVWLHTSVLSCLPVVFKLWVTSPCQTTQFIKDFMKSDSLRGTGTGSS